MATADLEAPPIQYHGWIPGAVRSSTLQQRYGCDPARLLTWERAGWIAATERRRGTGYPLWWSPAAQRMAAFLALEAQPRGGVPERPEPAQLRRLTWRALQKHPNALWFVLVGDRLVPSWSDHTLARLLARAPGPVATVVSPPLLPG